MIIYQYNALTAYYTGNSEEVADDSPIPTFWTDDALPEIPSGMYARYNFPEWIITDLPPPVLPPPASEQVVLIPQVAPMVI